MSIKPSAGDFEMLLSEKLAKRIISGDSLTIELVAECYEQAGDELSLPATAADVLHVEDIFNFLKSRGQLSLLTQLKLEKLIFDGIYLH